MPNQEGGARRGIFGMATKQENPKAPTEGPSVGASPPAEKRVKPPPSWRRRVVPIAAGVTAAAALAGVGVGIKIGIDHLRSGQEQTMSETKKVNPDKIFNNTANEGNFTDNNSVAMTPGQYRNTSPRLINGDSVVIPLPIELPEGQTPNVKFKKEKGAMFGGQRSINGRLENGNIVSDGIIRVNDVFILGNLPVGSKFLSQWDGEIEFATSSGYENPDGSLTTAAFTIYTTDGKGNKGILTVSTVRVNPLIEPSRIEYESGTNTTKPLTKKPIKIGEPIVEILTTDKHSNFDGQIRISALSRVEENGQRRGGAAGIEIATTPDGQAIRLDGKSGSK